MKKLKFEKPTKKKRISISRLKKKAWTLFSQWIRYNDSEKGLNMCITCGTWKPWKELQAGHFIPGRHNSILFDERGCHPQCYRCNVPLKGNPRSYDRYMRTMYGENVIQELEVLDQQTKNFKPFELEEIITLYTKKLQNLSKEVICQK